ncbi:MAG TPA: ABC transporter substrate-binding protein [Thermoleophilaceae bacterium]|nr:ABC transporter substrate-binding protein [Thermoleophilaceae bacterium]
MRARIVIALALVGALVGCQESGFDESKETRRPLKVQHAMDPLTGTKVPGQAERPVTLTADTLGDTLALGVKPVGAALPGARVPPFLRGAARGIEIVPDNDFAAIEAAEPDLILGAKEFQGDAYDELRKIAPTVMSEGYDWMLNLRLHGEALGRTNDAEELLIEWDNRVAKVKGAIGGRNISVMLTVERTVREFDTRPDSFARMLLAELGIKLGRSGDEVLHVDGGQEWVGRGGVIGARDALADVAHAL